LKVSPRFALPAGRQGRRLIGIQFWGKKIFMKVLIIDNSTSYLNQLQSLLPPEASHTTIDFSEIDKDTAENFDVAILSGGHSFPVAGNENRLEKEIDFVSNYKKPIFGICFGFELIASIFGAKLEQMERKEHGVLNIEVIEPDDIFLNTPNFSVYESHRWVVREPGEQFITLAKSKDGVEAIKHKTRPIYAVQFHPEMFIDKTCGDEIFHNFLNLIK